MRGRLTKDSSPSGGQKASFNILKIRDFFCDCRQETWPGRRMLLFSKKENSMPLSIKGVASCGFLWRKKGIPEIVLMDQLVMLLLESKGRERGSFISQA